MSKLSDEKITLQVVKLIESGVVSWTKIAGIVGLSRKTLHRWRDVGDETYKKAFAGGRCGVRELSLRADKGRPGRAGKEA